MKFLDTKVQVPLIAAAFIALCAGSGCSGPSVRKMTYDVLVERNAELEEQSRSQKETMLELHRQINELRDRQSATNDVLVAQATEKREVEERKKALLQRLKNILKGTPCEAERRGDDYVIITRFSFVPGKADLDTKAKSDLKKIAGALAEGFGGANLMIAGHADKSPINKSSYASNWHLSGERARSVMEFLVNDCKLPSDKIVYAGYGEFRPVADNSTPEGREKNRRVEIIVTP